MDNILQIDWNENRARGRNIYVSVIDMDNLITHEVCIHSLEELEKILTPICGKYSVSKIVTKHIGLGVGIEDIVIKVINRDHLWKHDIRLVSLRPRELDITIK